MKAGAKAGAGAGAKAGVKAARLQVWWEQLRELRVVRVVRELRGLREVREVAVDVSAGKGDGDVGNYILFPSSLYELSIRTKGRVCRP